MNQPNATGTVMVLVPDYYKNFACKGGTCRNTCCRGWKVSMPMTQYFKLLNLDCDAAFREKVARSMRLSLSPTPDTYAEFAHGYDGSCPLLAQDGLCELHRTCGADHLPTICRQYPRVFRRDLSDEACTVNSCERTLELLFEQDDPLSFQMEPMDASLFPKHSGTVPMVLDPSMLRAKSLALLSDRTLTLPERLVRLRTLFAPYKSDGSDTTHEQATWSEADQRTVRRVLFHLVDGLTSQNRTIEEMAGQAGAFEDETNFAFNHLRMKQHLIEVDPKLEIHFEKLLANHLYYRSFPFLEGLNSTEDAYAAMIGTVAVVRYFTYALMRLKNTFEDLVDVLARLFRIVSHTRFESSVLRLLKEIEGDHPATLHLLCAY